MRRRASLMSLLCILLFQFGVTAQAAEVRPAVVADSSMTVYPPSEYQDGNCGYMRRAFCGSVEVDVTFTGFPDHGLESEQYGELIGTVQVTRTYGCQSDSGERLSRYQVKVREIAPLNTRYSILIPAGGGSYRLDAWLSEASPTSCPAGTAAKTYSIKAKAARVTLNAYTPLIPTTTYALPGSAQWRDGVLPDGLLAPH
jgi:hypothetical protein